MKSHHRYLAIVLFSIAGAAGAQTSGQGQGPGQGERRGPPPEAIAACKGKASGATCSFANREGEQMSGTCFAPPAKSSDKTDLPLACRPDRGGKGKG